MKLSSAAVTAANTVKRHIIDIVLANLRYDVILKLIDPKAEMKRMYPEDDPPASVEARTTAL